MGIEKGNIEYLTKGLNYIPQNYKLTGINEMTTYDDYLKGDSQIINDDFFIVKHQLKTVTRNEYLLWVYDFLEEQNYSPKEVLLLKIKDAYIDMSRWTSAYQYQNDLNNVISENEKASKKNLLIYQVFLAFSLFFWIFSFLFNIFYIGLSLDYHPFLANFFLILALFLYLPRLWSKKKAKELFLKQKNLLDSEAFEYFKVFKDNVLSNPFLNSLSPDFSSPSALIALHNYISIGRADDLKEAINLFVQEQKEALVNNQNIAHQKNMESMVHQNTTVNTINMINNIFKK
jgi:hypothetical protein